MPQLNTDIWLTMASVSWFILVLFIPMKILTHSLVNHVSFLDANSQLKGLWFWPW